MKTTGPSQTARSRDARPDRDVDRIGAILAPTSLAWKLRASLAIIATRERIAARHGGGL